MSPRSMESFLLKCWFHQGQMVSPFCQSVGEVAVDVTEVNGEGTFSRMLEKVSLMSLMLMTKVPSLECWRRFR